jgi:hypothetical protein
LPRRRQESLSGLEQCSNLFSLNGQRLECPVDLREKTITVRFDRTRRDTYIVYLNDRRIGPAHPVNLTANGHRS